MTTLFGNFLLALPDQHHPRVAAPLRRRPASAGCTPRRNRASIGFNAVSNDFLGLALGGGAIGFVSDTAGLRFDIRYLEERVLGRRLGPEPGRGLGPDQLLAGDA